MDTDHLVATDQVAQVAMMAWGNLDHLVSVARTG